MASNVGAVQAAATSAGQRSLAVEASGRLWLMSIDGVTLRFYYSDNGGSTFTANATITAPSTISSASMRIDNAGAMHVVFADLGAVRYAVVRTPGVAFTAPVLIQTGSLNPDIAVYYSGATWSVNVACSALIGGSYLTRWVIVGIAENPAATGGFDPPAPIATHTLSAGGFVVANPGRPSVDFQHTGDGKTPTGFQNLYFAWTDDGTVKFVKVNKTGFSISISFPLTIGAGVSPAATGGGLGPALWFDGTRVVMVWIRSGGGFVEWYERDEGNTVTTAVGPITSPDGTLTDISGTWTPSGTVVGAQDVWLAVLGATADPLYAIYSRAAGTLGSWTAIEAVTASDLTLSRYQVSAVDFTYTVGAFAKHHRVGVNSIPAAPTWDVPQPIIHNVASGLLLDWTVNDVDLDPQVQYRLDRQVNGGVLKSWDGAAWQTVGTVTVATSTTAVTIPTGAGTLGSDGDVVDYWVYTYDGVVWSPVSAAKHVTMSAQNNPTITAPTGTITTASATATWTVAEQTYKRVQLYNAAGTGLLWDSGWETSAVASRLIEYVLSDLTTYTLKIQTRNNEGLESTVVSGTFSVDYVEPAIPTLTVTENTPTGAITIAIDNPTPSGAQPAVASNELWVRVNGQHADGDRPNDSTGIRIAVGIVNDGSFVDWAVASTFEYEYRARTIAANGTAVWSAWST